MNKRILSLVTVVVLLMTMFAFSSVAMADMNYTAYSKCSNGKPLNIRSGPGKEYSIIGSIPYGQAMVIYEDRSDGWSEIYYGSYGSGYVMTSLTSKKNPGQYVPTEKQVSENNLDGAEVYNSLFNSAKFVTPYTVTLTETKNSKGVANVRWAPSKKATLLKKYPTGTEVTVIAELGKNWYQVSDVDGAVGFVNTAYVVK